MEESFNWVQIGYAVMIAAMIAYLWPNAKRMWKESPKASSSDWHGLAIPLIAIILFIMLLIQIV